MVLFANNLSISIDGIIKIETGGDMLS